MIRTQFEDPEAASDALRPLERRLEPHSSRFQYVFEKLPLNGLTLIRETLVEGISACGVPAPHTRSVAFLRQPGKGIARYLGRELTSDSLMLTQDGREWSLVGPKASQFYNLVFDPVVATEHIEATCGPLARLDLPQEQGFLEVPPPTRRRLFEVLDATWTQLDRLYPSHLPGGVRDQIRETLLDALTPALVSIPRILHETSSPSRRARAVQMAIAHAEACSPGIAGVPSLCRVTGVSRRTLEYAFHEAMGLGPARYLKLRRLESARRDFEAHGPSETTVTNVALSWGFSDLSQFAHDYRREFGELPSETLVRG